MVWTAWPFLIGHRYPRGYRTILAPGFIIEARLEQSLADVAFGPDSEEASAFAVSWSPERLGEVTVVYRVVRPIGRDFGLPGSDPLTAVGGRPFRVFEGVVVREPLSRLIEAGIRRDAVDRIHAVVAPVFKEFWESTDEIEVRASEGLELAVPEKNAPALTLFSPRNPVTPLPQPEHQPEPDEEVTPHIPGAGPRRFTVAIGLLTGLILLGVLAFLLRGGGGRHNQPIPTSPIPTRTSP